MSKTYTIKFSFDYYSSEMIWGRYEAERQLKLSDSLRKAAISVMNEALENGADIWTSDIDNDSSISIYVASRKIKDTDTGYDHSGFGTKYALDADGGIVLLEDYAPLHHDWNLAQIQELLEHGYIEGVPHHIIIGLPEGLGAGPQDIFDWLGFFADTLQVVGSTVLVKKYIIIPLRDRNIRKITKKWTKNGIKYPSQLREFIDTKADWELYEVKKRLKIDDEYAIKLLTALGLEPQKNSWRLSHSKQSIKNRKKWLRNEKRYIKENS